MFLSILGGNKSCTVFHFFQYSQVKHTKGFSIFTHSMMRIWLLVVVHLLNPNLRLISPNPPTSVLLHIAVVIWATFTQCFPYQSAGVYHWEMQNNVAAEWSHTCMTEESTTDRAGCSEQPRVKHKKLKKKLLFKCIFRCCLTCQKSSWGDNDSFNCKISYRNPSFRRALSH